MPQNMIETDPR